MTLKEAAQFINDVGESWIGLKSTRTIYDVSADAAVHCSNDEIFNVAAYLKSNYGHMHEGLLDSEWMDEAEAIVKILRSKI